MRSFFAIPEPEAPHAGGVQVEMTGQEVTERTGGAHSITDESRADRGHAHCRPRRNASQSLELALPQQERESLRVAAR